MKEGKRMFTGIIEELGTIGQVDRQGHSGQILVKARKVLEGTKIGDSIAVDGICLTVTALSAEGFRADVMAETFRRSGLGTKHVGDKVNLERAMAANGRFGGHMVSGHIDGTGVVREYRREENAVWVFMETEEEILRLIVEKGSIAIDGISLTVAEVNQTGFGVSVIPHTGEETTLLKRRPGDVVNLENDIVGKYVERLLGMASSGQKDKRSRGLTMEFLESCGI